MVTKKKDKDFMKCLQEVINGGIHIPTLMEEIETGVVHKKDDVYTVDGRWDFKYRPRTDFVFVGDDFMKIVTAATYAVNEEWGGLVFGKVIKFRDNCNLFICEKVALMAQVRGTADFEIKDEHYQAWVRTDEFIDFMKEDCARIGWVHSHVNMGCFWSGTDKATIKQLIEEETNDHIISLVVSKRNDKKLDTKYLTSNRGVHNEIQFRIPEPTTSEVVVERIIYETELPCFDDFSEKYRVTMDARMKALTVIEQHTSQQAVCAQSVADNWRGVQAGGAGKQMVAIPQFVLLVADHDVKVREFLNSKKGKWKMKNFVAEIPKEKLIKMLDFFLKTSNRVQSYLITYNNFGDIADLFLKMVVHHSNTIPDFRAALKARYGEAWPMQFRSSLVPKTYSTTTASAHQRPTRAPDWDDIFFELDEKHQRGLFNAIVSVQGLMFKEMTKKVIDSLEWRVRGEEEKWVDSFVGVYMALHAYRAKYRKKSTVEALNNAIESLLTEMFKSFRGKGATPKKSLQMVVNCLPDKLIVPFLHDFVADFETQEELDNLYAEGQITVKDKLYGCPICENWWVTKKDAEKCKKTCEKIEKKKFGELKKPAEIKSGSSTTTSPKGSTVETHQRTLSETLTSGSTSETPGGKGFTGESAVIPYIADTICGMTPNYWNSESVCAYCGMEYQLPADAGACESVCIGEIQSQIADLINLQGYALCSQCGWAFTDEESFTFHMGECKMTGMRLHNIFRLNSLRDDLKLGEEDREKFLAGFNDYLDLVCLELDNPDSCSTTPQALYPPIISWLIDVAERKVSLWYCGKCGMTFDGFTDLTDGLYVRYHHEKACTGRQSGWIETDTPGHFVVHGERPVSRGVTSTAGFPPGTIPIKYMYHSYFCGLCDFTNGFVDESDLMQHLEKVHNVKLAGSVLSVVVEDADNVYKELYPHWQEEKFASGVPLNKCTFCGTTYLGDDKMENNSMACFKHEFGCTRRFPRN